MNTYTPGLRLATRLVGKLRVFDPLYDPEAKFHNQIPQLCVSSKAVQACHGIGERGGWGATGRF